MIAASVYNVGGDGTEDLVHLEDMMHVFWGWRRKWNMGGPLRARVAEIRSRDVATSIVY